MKRDGHGLEDKVSIITGGSEGIGAATAHLFAEHGADVVIVGRTRATLEATAKDIERDTGRRCLAVVADVQDEEQVRKMVDRTLEAFGRVDILVNNVGWAKHHGPLSDLETEAWRENFVLNLDTAYFCTRAVGPHFRAQESGAIVNVSTVAAEHGILGFSAFSAAKAALHMFTRVSAGEWGPYGIRVNCVAPGLIATTNAIAGAKAAKLDIDAICGNKPLRRAGKPEEVASAIVFLAGSGASYITGEILAVRGGPTLGGSA